MGFAHINNGQRVAIVNLLREFFGCKALHRDFVVFLEPAKIFIIKLFDIGYGRVLSANRTVALPLNLDNFRF